MKKIITILLMALLAAALSGFALASYFWYQMTRLPDWYQSEKAPPKSNSLDRQRIDSQQMGLRAKIQHQIQQQFPDVKVPLPAKDASGNLLPFVLPATPTPLLLSLNSADIQQVVLEKAAKTPKLRPIFDSTKAIKTEIGDRTVDIGVVVNTGKMVQSTSNPQDRQQIEQLFKIFPQFKDRDLALRLEGQPQLKGQGISLDPRSKVTMGNVSFTLGELAQKLGIPPDKIGQYLTLDAKVANLKAIQLDRDQMTLKIAP